MRNIKKENARNKLKMVATKRMQTTMNGAIASIEQVFDHLWGQIKDNLTPEEEKLDELYEQLRNEILDKGNNQLRLLMSDLDGYEVEPIFYEFVLRKENGRG